MFRRNSLADSNGYAESIQSNGYSSMDEDVSQASNLLRPNGKLIYKQRRKYASSINQIMDKFQYRVEHLFTCELDGKELKNVADCVERLTLLDGAGRVWGQSMLLEVRGPKLMLTDIETKAELESMALHDIQELKAVMNSGVFDSLLTVLVQLGRKRTTSVFMFQCDDVKADYIERDLSRALSRSSNARPRSAAKSPEPRGQRPVADSWIAPDYEEDDFSEPDLFVPDEGEEEMSLYPPQYTELDRDIEILNHILNDIEAFVGQTAVVAEIYENNKKKQKRKAMNGMPSDSRFAECLQKFKYAFNLVGEHNEKLNNPSATELIHSLFTTLAFVVSHCPGYLPPTVITPLLTPQCIRLMNDEASLEEDLLWQSLGDAWNIPNTKWPEDQQHIQSFSLEFADGWQPPEVSASARPNDPHPALYQTSANWSPRPSQKLRSGESKPQHVPVIYDFIARNNKELTVRKGETVQVLDSSKQWWKVRNGRGEEGFVPNNIMEDPNVQQFQQSAGPPVLSKRSKPTEVKAWLEYKGFSKITVRVLGGLSGSMLLGMAREELKIVCPEEGGRVFFHLRAVKSAMAAAS